MGSIARFADEYADAADSADAGGGRLGVVAAPSFGSPIDALRRASGPAPAPSHGGDLDATGYQLGRASLERALNDNLFAKSAQQTAMNDADRARDPGLQSFDDARRHERMAGDVAAADRTAIDHFAGTESLRRAEQREKEQNAAGMLAYNPAVLQSEYKREGVLDTNDARRDVATSAAGARTGSSAMSSLARMAGTQTFGDPAADSRIKSATDLITPNVPGAANGLKQLPPEWDFNVLVEKFGGDAAQADEWLRHNGYRR